MDEREKDIRRRATMPYHDFGIHKDVAYLMFIIDGLREAAGLRLKHGHSLDCPKFCENLPCTCAHDALAQAVKKGGE